MLNSVHLSHWIVRTHCLCTAGIAIAGNILCEESFYLSTVSLFIIFIILFGIFMHESSVFLSVLSAIFDVRKAYEMIKAFQTLHMAVHSGFCQIRGKHSVIRKSTNKSVLTLIAENLFGDATMWSSFCCHAVFESMPGRDD